MDVHVRNRIVNQSNAPRRMSVQVSLVDVDGKTVATVESSPQTIEAGKSIDVEQDLNRLKLRVWDVDEPNLYRAIASVRDGDKSIDEDTATFGVRVANFDADTGFWLNGKNIKLKGVCLHGDAGGLGVAVPLSALRRRLQLLKDVGCNAIRTAHNPPAPEFLDLCDRMGFLVMDEMFDCWTVAKNRFDYHLYFRDWSAIDTRDTVRRDRNHPSIIVYSAGNEIHDTPKAELAKGILRSLLDVFHLADPTRPVTQALFRPNVSHDYDNGLADMLDVVGQNYRENEILAAHRAKPERKILGTENQQGRDVWLALRDNAPYSGQFLWSGVDYLGEAGRWPLIGAGSGLLDRTGAFKPIAYERQSWWSDKPMVHITRRVAPNQAAPTDPGYEPVPRRRFRTLFDDWSPANRAPHDENVEIYSNCEDVELELNGQSLGSKPLPADASPRRWRVPFQPGIIKAIGKNKGAVVGIDAQRTAGQPAAIQLFTDRDELAFDWNDVAYVTAKVVDSNGVVVPTADNLITFGIKGRGVIAGVDNADNASHESFRGSQRHVDDGLCIAILRATARQGRITLTAESRGLPKASIVLEVRQVRDR